MIKFILGRLLKAVRAVTDSLTILHSKAIDSLKDFSSLFRVYYDSPIGSPIEKNTEDIIIAAVSQVICEVYGGKISVTEGQIIAKFIVGIMDRSKLMYQYNKDMIGKEEYYEELSARIYATLCATMNLIPSGLQKMSDILQRRGINTENFDKYIKYYNIAMSLAKQYLGDFFNEGKVTSLLKDCLVQFDTETRELIDYYEYQVKRIKEYGKKCLNVAKNTIISVCSTAQIGYKKLKENVTKSLKDTELKVNKTVEAIKKWIHS